MDNNISKLFKTEATEQKFSKIKMGVFVRVDKKCSLLVGVYVV